MPLEQDVAEARLLADDGAEAQLAAPVPAAASLPAHRSRSRRAVLGAAAGLALLAAGAALSNRGGGVLRGGTGAGAALQLQQVVAKVHHAADDDDEHPKKATHADKGKQEDHHKEPQQKEKPACARPHAKDSPGLFCWSVMFDGDEPLVKSQLTGRVGQFACNDYAVISPKDMVIGTDECGEEVRTWQETLPSVQKGMYGVNAETSSWLNVPIFLICWDRVIKSGKVWEQDFTAKLDPDAVFFPDRLRPILQPHVGTPIFTTDCRFWGGDQVGKLFGAIEVLSKQAVGAYKSNADKCKTLPWQGWGEDMWMQKCMDANGIPAVGLFDQIADNTCPMGGFGDCAAGNKVVFHPRKDAGQWWECWKQSAQPAGGR